MTPERVRFSSHRFPFFVEVTQCSSLACECGELMFELDEASDREELPPDPMCIRIRVDPETWQEVEPPPRSPVAAAIVQEFLRDYPAEQRAVFQKSARRKKDQARRLREYRIPPKDVESGLLIAWGDIISDRTSRDADGSSFLDFFEHEGVQYLVDDLYCANPRCDCREVHLLFVEYHAPQEPGAGATADELFAAIISLDGGLKVDRCFRGTIQDANAIAAAWQASYGDDLEELEWRYHKIKEIAQRTAIPPRKTQISHPFNLDSALSTARVGRNDPCPCGSGMKYKRCCGR